MKTSLIFNLAVALVALSTGCNRDGVKVYHVSDSDTASPTPPPATTAAMPATMPGGLPAPDNSGLPSLQYTLPTGWEKKAPTVMRVASFGVTQDGKSADVSVIPMGGMAGGNLTNVIRWRGQVGLGSIEQDAMDKMTEKVVIAGQDADLFDIAGTGPDRIIASVLHRDDTSWFFKITGDAALVEAQKPAFVAFLKSVSFGAPTAAAPATDMSQLPPGHPPMAGTSLGTQNILVPNASTNVTGGMVNDSKPAWTVPAGWQEAPLTPLLTAKYVIFDAAGAQAVVNISSLDKDGGGLLANVNRWRNQLGLEPFKSETDLKVQGFTGARTDTPAFSVDYTGTDAKTGKPARLIGTIIPKNGLTWFYKLMGDEPVVAQQKDAFLKFVQSAKYPDAH